MRIRVIRRNLIFASKFLDGISFNEMMTGQYVPVMYTLFYSFASIRAPRSADMNGDSGSDAVSKLARELGVDVMTVPVGRGVVRYFFSHLALGYLELKGVGPKKEDENQRKGANDYGCVS